MAEPIDISDFSPEQVKDLLEKTEKPVLCLATWARIELHQAREETDINLVAEYEEAQEEGDTMPPSKGVFVCEINKCKVYDGIHTILARYFRGETKFPMLLTLGTVTDADIAASGANTTHGAKRTNADKRNAVKILLRNPELAGLSNNMLAKTAKVSPQLVEDVRVELENAAINPVARPKKRRVARNGVEYEIDAPAAQATSANKSSVVVPEKLVKRIVGYIAKQVETQSAEERIDLCLQVIAVITEKYSLK